MGLALRRVALVSQDTKRNIPVKRIMAQRSATRNIGKNEMKGYIEQLVFRWVALLLGLIRH
jgi:hypothetical protein